MESNNSLSVVRFNKLGYAYMPNILSEEEQLRFASIMLVMKEDGKLLFEGLDAQGKPSVYYKNSYGGNHPEFESALRRIQPRIEEELGITLTPSNSYARIYYNGSMLSKHTDRVGLEYTLSITLFSNLDTDWPLWCIDNEGTQVPITIHTGDGAMMLGTKLTHWREPLECKEDQFVVQLFMHWNTQ
jgi:hypothetical protein